jgi:hypothetical protein
MTTLKDYFEAIEYKITEGSDYLWQCYGPDAHQLDSQTEDYTINVVFDKLNQTVYQLEAWDYRTDRYYRWINPSYLEAFKDECTEREIDYRNAIDTTNFVDLELAEDLLEKARAIMADEEYDTRVQVPLDLDDDLLFDLMKMAHEHDVTLNQMVEVILRQVIEQNSGVEFID